MAVIVLSWVYMFLICTLIGIGTLGLVRNRRFSVTLYLVTGVIGITVYAQFFSIFAKLGLWAHVVLVATALVCGYRNRSTVWQLWQTYRPVLCSWEGFFYCCFVLLIAFFTARSVINNYSFRRIGGVRRRERGFHKRNRKDGPHFSSSRFNRFF